MDLDSHDLDLWHVPWYRLVKISACHGSQSSSCDVDRCMILLLIGKHINLPKYIFRAASNVKDSPDLPRMQTPAVPVQN